MRRVKQLLYGLLFLTFWVAVIGGAYYAFLKPAPSCFDGVQNQSEAGVDCGGTCLKVCVPERSMPRVSRGVEILPLASATGTVRVSFLGEVSNPERGFAAKNFIYTFEALDASGNVVASFPDATYLYADEVRYLTAPNKVIPGNILPVSARLTLSNVEWVPAERMPRPKIALSVASATDEGATFAVRGTITNQDTLPFRRVSLLGLFYDGTGTLLGVSNAELETLAPGDPREFAIFHPPLSTIDPSRVKVFATAYNFR